MSNPRIPMLPLAGSLFALALAGAAPAVSAQVAGQMLFVKGDVRILGVDGRSRAARQGEMIQEGERVVTGPDALGQVKLTDGGFVGVRPGSGVRFAPGQTGTPRSMELTGGNVRVLNAHLGADAAPYVLKTPHGELEMRGADALAGILPVAPGDGGTERTVVKLNRGTGTALGKAGTPLELGTGDAVSVRPGAGGPRRLAALSDPALSRLGALPAEGRGVPAGSATEAVPTSRQVGIPRIPTPPALAPVRTAPVTIARPTSFASAFKVDPTSPPPPQPSRIDPNVITAITTGRLPSVSFTGKSTSTINDAARDIISAGTGSRLPTTTLIAPTTTTGTRTTILAPTTSTGSLTGTLTGTRLPTTSTTTVKTGTFTLQPRLTLTR